MVTASLIGNPISPYVRKVMAVCALKGVGLDMDPITPFFGSDAFTALSPLRRVPVYRDDQVDLCDSSVICQYLEELRPDPTLFPGGPATRARARWLEEYADTAMADVIIWKLFNNAVIAPAVFGAARDAEKRERAITQELPPVLDYLEAQLGSDLFLVGDFSLADLACAAPFANLEWSRVQIDWSQRAPLKAWLDRVRSQTPLGELDRIGAQLVVTPVAEHRDRARALGLSLTETTLGQEEPRKGPLTV